MKKIAYQPKQVRVFLLLLFLVVLILAFRFFRQGTLAGHAPLLAIAATVIAVMLAMPRVFFPLYKAILIATGHLGNAVFAMISLIIFFLILTPISLVMRLLGKGFLNPAPDPSLSTYYDEAEIRQGIERQF